MRWTSRFFLRDKAISMVFGLISIIPLGATVFFSACKMSGFELLYNLVRIQYLINLGWMGMTIVFMRKAEANDLRDCIDTCTESHFFFERSALIWILFVDHMECDSSATVFDRFLSKRCDHLHF